MLADAAELLLGTACPGCGEPGWRVCAACLKALDAPPREVQRAFFRDDRIPLCYAAAGYEGPVTRMLVGYKEERVWRIAPVLADALARACAAVLVCAGVGEVTLVPVPSTPAAVRRRGLDTTAHLARRAAARLRGAGARAYARSFVRHRRRVADQTGLDAASRARNVMGALSAGGLTGHRVLLVDDVVTTGASLAATAQAVGRAGGLVLGGAVVAARGWR